VSKIPNIAERAIETLEELGQGSEWGSTLMGKSSTVFLQNRNSKEGALACVFRPVGVVYEGRQKSIQEAVHVSQRKDFQIRFEVGVRRQGAGAGAVTIQANSWVYGPPRQKTRLGLIRECMWADEAPAMNHRQDIGDMGLVPRELAPYFKRLLPDYPYVIPYYQMHVGREYLSVRVMLLIWGLGEEAVAYLTSGPDHLRFIADLEQSHQRTMKGVALDGTWAHATRAYYIAPGYQGKSQTD